MSAGYRLTDGNLIDTIGLKVEEALEMLHRAGVRGIEIFQTEPPSHPHKSDIVRVVAQRDEGNRIKLIVSTEAYIQPYRRIGGNRDEAAEPNITDVRS
ncbi:MAG: hypothetical protein RMK18_07405 [Armatimonadota bacterium]|nr:hypothetical protein [Armatimonadota bacterium]MCX7778211.1 hypothetical protein [Armatimonadota bacterium]MDW8025674.1 hypothetical protein [Armatimonadota bacterium]